MCNELLSKEDFNFCRSGPDGLTGYCKECGIKYKQKHYEKNYAISYNNTKEYRKSYPEKRRAFQAVQKAIKNGEIDRPESCSKCGKCGYIVAHHDDYDRPLDITWLCLSCDRQLHAELKRQQSIIK